MSTEEYYNLLLKETGNDNDKVKNYDLSKKKNIIRRSLEKENKHHIQNIAFKFSIENGSGNKNELIDAIMNHKEAKKMFTDDSENDSLALDEEENDLLALDEETVPYLEKEKKETAKLFSKRSELHKDEIKDTDKDNTNEVDEIKVRMSNVEDLYKQSVRALNEANKNLSIIKSKIGKIDDDKIQVNDGLNKNEGLFHNIANLGTVEAGVITVVILVLIKYLFFQ